MCTSRTKGRWMNPVYSASLLSHHFCSQNRSTVTFPGRPYQRDATARLVTISFKFQNEIFIIHISIYDFYILINHDVLCIIALEEYYNVTTSLSTHAMNLKVHQRQPDSARGVTTYTLTFCETKNKVTQYGYTFVANRNTSKLQETSQLKACFGMYLSNLTTSISDVAIRQFMHSEKKPM